jgi:hypothetical protein
VLAKRKAAEKEESSKESDKENVETTPDILGEQEDADVIF